MIYHHRHVIPKSIPTHYRHSVSIPTGGSEQEPSRREVVVGVNHLMDDVLNEYCSVDLIFNNNHQVGGDCKLTHGSRQRSKVSSFAREKIFKEKGAGGRLGSEDVDHGLI